ncbi:MAG TPA: VTT domain-containing protein [Rectinemataceae bacterium]|nr:VTT domain-containing protein [Rectinemataceae bacterium]
MPPLTNILDLVLHVDRFLVPLLNQYGGWTYLLMFLVIFAETGLVVTPFLPGDSLLFALAALAAKGGLDIAVLWVVLTMAGVAGNTVNYLIGFRVGPAIFRSDSSRFLRRDYLERAHAFYEKYGGITVIGGRFMPIIRTFVPFVAGIAKMNALKFYIYNLIGCFAWVSLFLAAGWFFGQVPVVQHNFSLVALGIIVVSFIPPVVTAIRARKGGAAKGGETKDGATLGATSASTVPAALPPETVSKSEKGES